MDNITQNKTVVHALHYTRRQQFVVSMEGSIKALCADMKVVSSIRIPSNPFMVSLFCIQYYPTVCMPRQNEYAMSRRNWSFRQCRKWNEYCFRPWFCTVRRYWAGDLCNEMNCGMNHAPGAGSILDLLTSSTARYHCGTDASQAVWKLSRFMHSSWEIHNPLLTSSTVHKIILT